MGRPPKVTRDQVLTAARELFAERGFEGTTLAAIAAKLRVSPAALLRHAANKEALFTAAMASGVQQLKVPLEFLAELDGSEDPRRVLRQIGEVLVPFIEERLAEQIARWMRAKTSSPPGRRAALGPPRIELPFDPNVKPTPPQRALALIEDYLRKAALADRLELRDPRAAALMLLASLQGYVTLHQIVRIAEPPLPLDRYLDSLVAVWTGRKR
ncbi:MAG TPA: helix-turn-helix domain-containing protein [Thermoanaerobaculia bacterium]|jgi:AcrR family transcriptional regulator|nr:helix-turn-helix domain-containing protein [Thermoanaerobaculia bacterium]